MQARERLLKAVEGKAAERGLSTERQGDYVLIQYDTPQDERQDNLHKQAVRSLVGRLGGEDWKIHILGMGESGFSVEVRPKPGSQVAMPPATPVEEHAQVEPGPVTTDQEVDLEDPNQIKELAAQLMGVAQKLTELAGGLLLVVSLM